ncbi:endonuclease 4 homolog [Papaver somniferum]|uniref:endonuclease 4 homolog n=1 Tax=Papaver somniferum TaxID=3469 RepID=UPI000E70305D|nr:endonuclease 4 homolog [Papaver somniferum]
MKSIQVTLQELSECSRSHIPTKETKKKVTPSPTASEKDDLEDDESEEEEEEEEEEDKDEKEESELPKGPTTTKPHGRLKKTDVEGNVNGKSGSFFAKGDGRSKEKGKSSDKEGLSCTHCKQTWHVVDKCWIKYPNLKPKGLQKKEAMMATLVAQDPKEVQELTEPNQKLSLMAGGIK